MARRVGVWLIVWAAMIGLDFVLNAAVFASMYDAGGTFMLTPAELFSRIPFGYAALLVLAVGVTELAVRVRVSTISDGLRLGFVSGLALGSAWSLGLYSLATVTPLVALALAGIWCALVSAAGAVAGAALGSRWSLRGLAVRVVGIDLLFAFTVIALQSFGIVPTLTP